ncbi:MULTISPECIES: beta strand repeat-containing protein [Cyanophyceae]|uniref:beta strand repeat-containing protein n=1 Tax=Cyanophyceae TaxID=3028117 RepID=UPI001688EEEE|nr:FG-GAP-like repeat-containing protein [Trichocoleus sp. FACHB-69]MBD1930326.1 FG-GAP repeat protein [Trichocoleus sp. FACHB-69]
MVQIFGDPENNILEGTIENETILGLAGNDTLNGSEGNDILQGSSSTTAGEIDILTGGTGSDTFVLGTPARVFYDDGNDTSDGTGDYALITDFNPNVDVIQLGWSKNNYILGAVPEGLPDGTAIFLDKPGDEPDELIAIVQGVTGLDLNQSYFGVPRLSAVELSNIALDTDNRGFAINGEAAGDRSGISVSNAGDVNGDGFDDLIIGASGSDPNGSGSGKSYVVFGKADGTTVSLSDVASGIGGFAINGEVAGDGSGTSVSSAGDVNGDGLDDLIIGAPTADPNGLSSGKSYVVFGKADNTALNLGDVASGIGGFAIEGEARNNRSGFSVSDAGDVNGDGFDDLIIGTSSVQKSYVVFGKADGTTVALTDVAAGTGGFVISGSGRSVSRAGDVNGDGFDDLIIGDRLTQPDGSNSGQSYVVFGKADGTAVTLSDVAAGSGGFVINGEAQGDGYRPIVLSDFSVSSAGDVNGDGFDDLIVGSRSAYPNGSGSGKSYVVFGKADGTAIELNDVAVGTGGFAINGEAQGNGSGISVSSAGDLNGDGKDDLIVGAAGADPNGNYSGKSYVVFGKADGTAVELSNMAAGIGGFALNGEAENDQSGRSVSGAGDVNNDGFDDLIVGAAGADPNGSSSGKSYVVFGGDFLASEPVANEDILGSVLLRKPLVIPAAELLKWNPDNVLTVTEVSNAVGGTVSLVDGVVTFQADPGFVGVATFDYTVNDSIDGSVTATASLSVNSTVELSDVALNTNTSGFVINGEAAGDYSGWSVSNAGDVNGDGLADLIVGSGGSLFSGNPGKSYVVFGKTDSSAVNLSEVTSGIGGFTINGEAAGDNSGFSVSGAGDVNGDGKDDLIVGAFGADPNGESSGKSYVVFGKADSTAVELSDVAIGIGGFAINGEAEGYGAGFSVSGAGDVNGDGLADLIIGGSYVVFGKADNSSVELSDVRAGTGGFAINGEAEDDGAGFPVSDAGDVNGDGLADLIVGASAADPNGESSGKSYVVFGKTDGTAVSLSDAANGMGGFVLNGEAAYDEAGISVSSAGDVNGDGLADLIVGADGADSNGNSSGKSYVVFGKTDNNAVNLSDVAAGNGGFVLNGEGQSSISGGSVSRAGDVNGDGLDDLIVGTNPITAIGVLAAIASPEPVPTFKSYVVFGKTDSAAVELSDVAAGIGGFALEKDYLSSDSVSGAGDVNGDGFDDVMVGTPFTDPNGNIQDNSGQSYVVYGGDFTGAVTNQGATGDDLLTGTAATDVIVAGQGNDTLIGNGGSDILYAGAGDDVIAISDLNFNRIKGGSGTDTLRVDGSGMFFDLKAIANNRITGIEQIDLNDSGSNALAFNKLDVLALSDTNQLAILGNTSDVVVSLGQGWKESGTQTLDGNLYNEYAVGGVSLLVDSDISQFIS